MTCKKMTVSGIATFVMAFVVSGGAKADLVNNGSFTATSGYGQFDYNTSVTGWTSTNAGNDAYNFIFNSTNASDGTGVAGQYGNIQLWGPGNGSANGLTASPDGGNFVAADGAFQTGAIQQTISGLTAGDAYQVTFYWAGAQQSGFTGATTEQWQVSLGGQTQSTAVVNNADHGFTGWMAQSMTFTATSTSEALSFLAVGTPDGVPPFVLLDGVSMNAVPEPSAVMLLGIGLIGLGAAGLRQRMYNRRKVVAAAAV